MTFSVLPRSRRLVSSLLLGASLALVGCAGDAARSDGLGADESLLVTQTRLDRVTPQEVAAAYASSMVPNVAKCVAAHPEITLLDRSHVEGFYRVGVVSYFGVRHFVLALLEANGGQPIPVDQLTDMVEPYAIAELSLSVDADGYYVRPANDGGRFLEAELAAREEKALTSAKNPRGTTLRAVREMWREVQEEQRGLDSEWLSPVRISGGSPSLADIRRAMNMPYQVRYETWGNEAIDEFHVAGEGPDETALFDPIADLLRGPGIKKRWYFAGGGNEWSAHYLVVLDEHDQLWGFMMGYSE
ncbi:MAG: hypothetical protein KIS78_16435 [Labilithrix sp.]|nr:hypothetical protein [Labilithrix sp.]MCW5833989.1 hypothetical protein [Labilithrix sp.]